MVRSVLAAGGGRLLVLPVSGVLSLLTTRLVITGTGSIGFGFVSLIASLFAILPFGDLGLGAGVVNAVAQSPDAAEDVAVRRTIAASLQILTCAAVLLVASDMIMMGMNAWEPLLGAPPGSGVNVAAGWALAALGLGMPLALGQRVLLGLHRMGTAAIVLMLGSVVTTSITFAAERQHADLVYYAIAPPLGMAAASAAQCLVIKRFGGPSPWRVVKSAIFERLSWKGMSATAVPMLVVTLGLPLALQTDRIILSHFGSSLSLPVYSLGFQFYMPVWGLIASGGLALWPVFAKRRSAGQVEGDQFLRAAVGFFAVCGSVAGLGLVVGGLLLDSVVSGNRIHLDAALLVVFACLLVIQSVQLPLGMFFTDAPGLKFQAWCVAGMVPVSVGISLALAPALNGVGVLLGSIVAISVCQVLPGALRLRRATDEVQ